MADTVVDANVEVDVELSLSLWGPYYINTSTAIITFIDSARDMAFARTTDKGANWSKTAMENATARHAAVWFDQETPGDAGTLVHLFWLDSGAGEAYYQTVDISDGSKGTKRTVATGLTVSALEQTSKTAITKTVSGNILVSYRTGAQSATLRSDDSGATWDGRTDVFESGENDQLLFFPAATADNDDAVCLFNDAGTPDEVKMKMYDESGNSWSEFGTVVLNVENAGGLRRLFDAAVRHSDSHLLVVGWNEEDATTADLEAADCTVDSIGSPSVSAKTNILTNAAESGYTPGILINQQNGDVRVSYCKGGTYFSLQDVFYQLSQDGMATWDGETAYSENTNDDFRCTAAGRTVGDSGGRFQPAWFNDDLRDVFVNETNDIEFAAVGGSLAHRPVTPQRQALRVR